MKRYWFSLFFLFFLITPLHAAFFDRNDCDEVPSNQRVANGTFCLQRTAAGGRLAGITYIWNGTAWTQDANIPRVTNAAKPTSPKTGDVVVVTDALNSTTCTAGGGTANNSCQWNGLAWVIIGGGGGGGAGTPGGLDTQVQYNASGAFGGDSGLTYNAATDTLTVAGNVSVAGQSVCRADGTNCPGAGSFQPLDADLTTISALTGTGLLAHTGIGAWAERQITGAAGNIAITNPAGIAGNPIIDLGVTAVQTDQTNTYTTGDQNMAAASSFTPPAAPGAAPSAGRFAYDSTSTTFKGGTAVGAKTFAFTDVIQPLNTNLTAFSGLTGVAANIPYFTGPGAMLLTAIPLCIDSGGQHLNVTSLSPLTVTCGTSGGGGTITGLTAGTIPKAASPTTLTNSIISETAGVATVAGGLVVGTGSKIGFNTAALTTDRTWTILDVDGTIRPSTGVLTAGNMVTTNAGGQLIDGGAVGTGTWTDSSTNTGTNKTLVASGAGGTNTITVPIKAFWDGGAVVRPSTSTCTAAALTQINSGPSAYITTCADASTSAFEGSLTLTQAVTTVTFQLTVNDVDSSSHVFGGDFSAMCRGNNTTVNNTWGTSQSVAITMTTASNNYTGTTAAVTPNGTCGAGATLFWRFIVNTATFTDDGDARVIGVLMQQAS